MKHYLLNTMAILLIAGYGVAQDRLNLPTVYVQNTVTGKNMMPTDVIGSPYLDEEFKQGTVQISEDESYSAFLRYNAYNDEIEMQEGNKTVALMKRDYVTAEFGGAKYQVISFEGPDGLKQGYANPLNEGSVQLIKRTQVTLQEGREATSSYGKDQPPKFESRVTYHIVRDGATAKEIKLRKKDVLEALPSSSDLDSYVKQKKWKLRSEEEVVQLFNYLNSQ